MRASFLSLTCAATLAVGDEDINAYAELGEAIRSLGLSDAELAVPIDDDANVEELARIVAAHPQLKTLLVALTVAAERRRTMH